MSEIPDNQGMFVFADDRTVTARPDVGIIPWPVLVVDDDPDVHAATAFALDSTWVLERPIELLHADSAAQARAVLEKHGEVAVILLDVVMESSDAGLALVDHIRRALGMHATRIILRTGQPGYAPEHQTLAHYDINDYRAKSELTQHKLVTTLMAALRSYEQIRAIEAGRDGLQRIVEGSAQLMEMPGLQRFADGVLTHLAALLRTQASGLVCAQGPVSGGPYVILAAAGPYASLINHTLEHLQDHPAVQHLRNSLQQRRSHYGSRETVLYVGSSNSLDMAVYLPLCLPEDALTSQLLGVMCVNLSACLRNLGMVQHLHRIAYQDSLLPLPNRASLLERIDNELLRNGHGYSLALADIDNFSGINELMGHNFGDRVLQALADRLLEYMPQTVLVARVSGNSFGLFGPCADVRAALIQRCAEQPLLIEAQPFKIGITIGLCHGALMGASGENAFKNAAIALKQAKQQHRGGVVEFAAEMAQRSRHHAQLLMRLHAALDRNQLFLAYQPQIDLQTLRVTGIEALLRWRCDDGQMIPPDTFIPVAEQSGLIDALGLWVFKRAAFDMQQLIASDLAPDRMAVNVSVAQFRNRDFSAQIERCLRELALAPQRLELEITESVTMLGNASVESTLTHLRGLGFSIAIDDFGTGYSSLGYIHHLPLDRIKIDRRFVYPLQDDSDLRIVELITQLGIKLGVRVLAEGIENARTQERLRQIGCHEGQGFHIARPMPIEQLLPWLQRWPDSAATAG